MYIKEYLPEQSFDYALKQTLFKRANKKAEEDNAGKANNTGNEGKTKETKPKKTTPKDPEPAPVVVTTKKKKATTKKEKEPAPEPTPEPVIIPEQPVPIPTVTSEPIPTTKTKHHDDDEHKTKSTSILPTSIQTTSSNDGVSYLIDDGKMNSNNTSFYVGVFLGIIGFVVAVGLFIVGTQKYSKKKNYQTHLTRKVQNSRMSLLPTPNGNLNPSPLLRPGSTRDHRTSFSPTTYVGGQTLSPPNAYGYDAANASFNSAVTDNSSYYSNASYTQAYATNAATVNTSPINTSPIYSGDYQAQTAVNQDNYMEYQLPYANYPVYDYSYNYGYNNNLSPADGTAGVTYTVDASNNSIVSSVNMATQTTPPLGEDKAQTTSQDKDVAVATPGIVVSPPTTEATDNVQQQSQQQEFLDAPPPPKRRESKLVYYTNGSSPLLTENTNNGYSLEIPSTIESNDKEVVDQQNIASSEVPEAPVISITPPKDDTNAVEELKIEESKAEDTVDASNNSIVSSVNMETQTTSQDKDVAVATLGIVVSPPTTEATDNVQQQSQQQEFLDAPPPPKRRESKLVYYTNGSSPLLTENINNGYSLEIPSTIESNDKEVVDQQNIASSEVPEAPVISITPPKDNTNAVEELKVEESKAEETKIEETKIEETKVEETKIEKPKIEETKVEEPKTEELKVEEPKTEGLKVEESKTEEQK